MLFSTRWSRLLGLVLSLTPLAYPASGITTTRFHFKLNQLYEVSVGLEGLRGTPMAFGDFRGNQQTDLLVASTDQTTLELWEWYPGDKVFVHRESADITLDKNTWISNVIPGDFNMDGKLDVLVQGATSKTPSGSFTKDEVPMWLYLGDGDVGFRLAETLDSGAGALPFALDYTGDGAVDLLGVPFDAASSAGFPNSIGVWTGNPGAADGSNSTDSGKDAQANQTMFSLTAFDSASLNTTEMCKPANPHSNAFVDLDGDCLADLFIVCEGGEDYQIWRNSGTGFVYSQSGKLPSNSGPVSFADINADGSLDMVIPILGQSQIYVVYNEQRPLCVGTRKNNSSCRDYKRICEADPGFTFVLNNAQVIDVSKYWAGESLLDAVDGLVGFQGPPAVRLGDTDLDGHPDMVFVTKKSSNSRDNRVRILRSIDCNEGSTDGKASGCKATSGSNNIEQRGFSAIKDGVAVLEKLGGAQDVALVDLDSTGTVDLLVHFRDTQGNQRLTAIYNNFFTDAFFIKAQACPTASSSNGKHIRSYSGALPGASFKYLLVSDAGAKHVAQAVQAPQTAYRALFTPYTVIGIGRTNNYIEDFSVGSTSQIGRNVKSFEGLIPNSQVVVFPVNSSSEWRLELYMNRSESTPYILATLLSSMFVLGITVFALGALERKADKREKERALHSINFDAL
ncbi:hypothetical protein LPJ59_003215 [Coemansia sp. RSA 2399]|nr:hypothetical protein LPJ59_003215 [Coemansia sp. RSA 2399]KAJ1903794.1 hypothetical protein LPJ81_002869 [Coemansia sp. IMI 209127]